jgi:uncharacterized coiled-coil protein SlyX
MSRLCPPAALLLLSACYPEERVAETATAAVSGDLSAADARIAALEAEVATLRALLGGVEAGAPVHDRLVALEEGQATHATLIGNQGAALADQADALAAQGEAVAAHTTRLDAAEAALTANTAALAGHGVRLALVEESAEQTATAAAALEASVDAMAEAVDELEGLATTFQTVGFSDEVTVRAGVWDRTSVKALFCSMEAQEIGIYGAPDRTHCVLEHDAETSTWTLATFAERGPLFRTCRMVCLGVLE